MFASPPSACFIDKDLLDFVDNLLAFNTVTKTQQTFAAFDNVVQELIVDVSAPVAQSPVPAVQYDGRQAALEPGRTPSPPPAARSVAMARRQSADAEVISRQVEVDGPRVRKFVDARAAVDDQQMTTDGRSEDGHGVPGVVVDRRRSTVVFQHAHPAADIEHVANVAGR